MTPRQIEIVKEIRTLLKEAYDHYFEHSDGYCKSSEGVITICYPTYWNYGDELEANWIEIYSYVLGPSRNHDFKDFEEALKAVKKWHKTEMETDYSNEDELTPLPIQKMINCE